MSKVTSLDVPSSDLCDRIAVLNEEGMELRARLVAFAGEAGELARAFDSEIEPLGLDGDKLDHAATHCEAEIAKTEGSVERYMLAFGNGTITEEMFGERVRNLGTKAAALRSRRDDLRAALDAGGRSPLPTVEKIAARRPQPA